LLDWVDGGGDEIFIDLLFYHLKLHCYVVIELKGGKFKHVHLGQLSFYLTAVDELVKHQQNNPTIGLISATPEHATAGRASFYLEPSNPAQA
jgi:hypothetical protein